MLYCLAVVSIFALRLWIWKFFPGLESGIKDDLSNMIIASLVFGLAIFFFLHQAVRRRGIVRSGIDGPVALLMATELNSDSKLIHPTFSPHASPDRFPSSSIFTPQFESVVFK